MPSFPKQGKSKRGVWTKEQREYVERAVEFGCLVCYLCGSAGTPASWHHIREGYHGIAMRPPHHCGIALCRFHHVDGAASIHRNPEAFTALTGKSEVDLVALSQSMFGWSSNTLREGVRDLRAMSREHGL